MGTPDPSKDFSGLTYDQVERMIQTQLAAQEARHKEEMRAMQEQLDAQIKAMASRGVVALVPLHSAGFGTEIAETWSQHEQELARLGLGGLTVADYVKKLEGVGTDGGNFLQRVQKIEGLLEQFAESAHTHNGTSH